MAQTNKRALVFVKNSEIFYVEEKTSKTVKIINQPYLEDLETIDTNILTKSLNLWREKHKGLKLHIIIIFSDEVLFEKTFKNDDQDIEQKVIHYLDKVPFDRHISRHYERKDETDFVVISKDFYEEIVDCFEKHGFEVVNTLPEQLIKSAIEYKKINAEVIKKIFQKFDSFKNPKLSLNNKTVIRIKKKYHGKVKNRTTLIVLGSMLGVLTMTFFFILFMQMYFNEKTVGVTEKQLKQNVSLPEVDPNGLIKEKLTIEISYSPNASESAGILKNNLEANSYKNISLKVSYLYKNDPEIILPKTLSAEIKDEIIRIIQGSTDSLLIRQNEKTENIINISLK